MEKERREEEEGKSLLFFLHPLLFLHHATHAYMYLCTYVCMYIVFTSSSFSCCAVLCVVPVDELPLPSPTPSHTNLDLSVPRIGFGWIFFNFVFLAFSIFFFFYPLGLSAPRSPGSGDIYSVLGFCGGGEGDFHNNRGASDGEYVYIHSLFVSVFFLLLLSFFFDFFLLTASRRTRGKREPEKEEETATTLFCNAVLNLLCVQLVSQV